MLKVVVSKISGGEPGTYVRRMYRLEIMTVNSTHSKVFTAATIFELCEVFGEYLKENYNPSMISK